MENINTEAMIADPLAKGYPNYLMSMGSVCLCRVLLMFCDSGSNVCNGFLLTHTVLGCNSL